MLGTVRSKVVAVGGGALAAAVLLSGVAYAQTPGTPTPAPAPTQEAAPAGTPAPGARPDKECPEDGASGTRTPATSGFSRGRAPQA